MSQRAIAWAAQQNVWNGGRKCVLLMLAYSANNTGISTASQERLAKLSCMSVRALREHLRALADDGFIAVQARYRKNGERAVNHYYLAYSDAYKWQQELAAKLEQQAREDKADGILS
jgi:predicted ArsR family transcriptional regulator